MHAVGTGLLRRDGTDIGHLWVGAALVGLGRGLNGRAEHAARTRRHVISEATRIEVLEVYCGRCRVGYSDSVAQLPCAVELSRAG